KIEDGEVCSPSPCCSASVRVPIEELRLLGEVAVRCRSDSRVWRFSYDPWSTSFPPTRALWVAQ
ncbi:MAG: hypothetical protein ACRDYA_21590, partial [Egibacteraceae bacterium]